MDITQFVVSTRGECLVEGDHGAYRRRLSKKLLNTRRKLGITTKKGGKYQNKAPITAPVLAENTDYVRLYLLTSERAWANAISTKAIHTANDEMHGSNRSYVITRLEKAARTAEEVVDALSETDITGATIADMLEAEAYSCIMRGAVHLEKKKWDAYLKSYSTARVVYSGMLNATNKDIFKDLLEDIVDPSIRYAAYQLNISRTLEIPAIARRTFPKSDEELVARINEIDPTALTESEEFKAAEAEAKSISWRGRDVIIEDPAVATAWGKVEVAKAKLSETVSTSWSELLPRDKAAAYEDILTSSQDAVDATRTAIDELRAEGVAQSDSRMQGLQIARTAMNFDMVSWRIGRNRVLSGDHDGATMDSAPDTKRKQKRAAEEHKPRNEPPGKQIMRLKEKVALYNSTLQSLETLKGISGVVSDQALVEQIDGTYQYFTSLKCLAIARSHSMTGTPVNALALTKRAFETSEDIVEVLSSNIPQGPPSITVGEEDAQFLHSLLKGELQRCRALVKLEQLTKGQSNEGKASVPVIETIGTYPAGGVDLNNVVTYPPKLVPIPVKPVYLDVAWNYIDYPSKNKIQKVKKVEAEKGEEDKPAKKGWFGFGR
ncbi:signal recognition particle protein [Zalerion maritima]|uniref:Signal recognition particle subunit SRP68 n=1 Tax=Zalerion maritima TaxID=339359 RepID=A0AAD5WU81_9PEZI|nr:signal recognition particle protein [Zalerion maritima]